MSAPWYRCFPRDFNDGMDGLTLEERGAYITLLNLIYMRAGPIPEDNWWITSKLDCTSRTWVKIRASLLLKRKLYVVQMDGEGYLMNARAAAEIAEREEFSRKKSEAGSRGGRNSRPKVKEINDNQEAELRPCLSTTEAIHNHIHSSSVVPPNGETTAAKPPEDVQRLAWDQAVLVLETQGALTPQKARAAFGRMLKENGLEARDMLGPLGDAVSCGTLDPVGYLMAAAKARARRRADTGPPKRVSFV